MFIFYDNVIFKRGKDKVKRKSRMTKKGAAIRLGTSVGVGSILGSLTTPLVAGTTNKSIKKSLPLSAIIGGGLLGSASYLDHKRSPYSPVGKKNWKPMPKNHPWKKYKLLGFIPQDKID